MIWSVQVLRFVAALMVVYIHAAQTALIATGSNGFIPYELATIGLSGVDIFFVISGLIIARIAVGRSPAEFIWSRFKRIVPIYLLCSIPAIVVAIATGNGFGWREAVATFLFWPATDQITAPALMVGWTLCFEMLFYACAALVLYDRRSAVAIAAIFAVSFAFRTAGPAFQFLGNPIILEFVFGVAIARLPAWRPGVLGIPIGATVLVAYGISGLAPTGETMEFLAGKDGLQRVLVYGVPSAAIVYGTVQVRAREGVFTYLGDASYSLYLTHTFAVTGLLAIWLVWPMPADLIIIVGIAASLTLAWRVHEGVEKPILAQLALLRRRAEPGPTLHA